MWVLPLCFRIQEWVRFVRELFEGLLDGQVRFPMKVISGFRAFRRRKDGCMGAGRR